MQPKYNTVPYGLMLFINKGLKIWFSHQCVLEVISLTKAKSLIAFNYGKPNFVKC